MANLIERVRWGAFVARHLPRERRLPFQPLARTLGLQRRRIRAMVAHAAATVPFYREALHDLGASAEEFSTAEDLARLPLISAADLASAPERFLSEHFRGEESLPFFTSGTSGLAKTIHFDKAALFHSLVAGQRRRRVHAHFLGRDLGHREVSLLWQNAIALRLRTFYEEHLWVPRRFDYMRVALLPAAPVEELVARINEVRPVMMRGYGSTLGALFRLANERGLTLAPPRLVMFGSDAMPDDERRLIEETYGTPVVSDYAAVEALRIAFQCERRLGHHVDIDQVAVRVVGPDGAAVGPGGTGRIVISCLTNRAMVILNYDLGDVVTLGAGPCPCGRTLPTLERIVGRADEAVLHRDGYALHALVVLPPLQKVPGVRQVQLVQEGERSFLVRVVAAPGAGWRTVPPGIEAALASRLGEGLVVRVEAVERLVAESGGKVKGVICLLPETPRHAAATRPLSP